MNSILYVDDEESNLKLFQSIFQRHYQVFTAASGDEGIALLRREPIDMVITDQRMPGKSGSQFLEEVMGEFPDAVRIVLTAYSDVESILEAVNKGKVYHYASKPWSTVDLKMIIDKGLESYNLKKRNTELLAALREKNAVLEDANAEIKKLKARLEAENEYLQDEIKNEHNINFIIGNSPAFRRTLNLVEQVAGTSSTVLIQGETGTGKELIARAIHSLSARSKRAMVKVNCATLPANLIESELYGHEKGAFTGALNRKLGLFEIANDGTIFLDEIGELPLELQAKLLRVLQEGEFTRLGSTKLIRTDVRVIAATNRALEEAVNSKTFRSDLFYRLNVFPIAVPPLRDRLEDIPLLVKHFVSVGGKKIGRAITDIPEETIRKLMKYTWPGNIRELENVVERSIILSTGGRLQLENWTNSLSTSAAATDKISVGTSMEDAERAHIRQTLELCRWKIQGKGSASELLNMNPSTLRSRMKKLGIEERE